MAEQVSRAVDGAQDPRIGAAPADVAGQPLGDPCVVGMRGGDEQGGRRHQPAWRAEAALHRARLQPGLLHRMQDTLLPQALDGRDPLPGDLPGGPRAGGHRAPPDQDGARPAGALAAAEFRASTVELVPEYVKQADVRARGYLNRGA